MKKTFTLILLTVVFFYGASAQKPDGAIRGKLVDTLGKQPVADATISVINESDSSLVTFTLSNKEGIFSLNALYGPVHQTCQ